MRELVATRRPDLLALAVELTGADPFERSEDGTAYLQPAIYCASIASLAGTSRPHADLYAGHSMGELTALALAGSLDEHDGLRLVAIRGRLMQRMAEDVAAGAMLAVGAGAREVAGLARTHGLIISNDNSPEQSVLSGPLDAILAARAEAKVSGLRAFKLAVKGAFHSPLIEPAVPEFRAALADVEFRPPVRPVFSCVSAREFDDVRARLAESLTHPVRWREVLLALRERGATSFVEAAPGQVLTKLTRATLPGAEARALVEEEAVHA
jgi:[acyl-carrier-protein] S-malonyltransferase